MHGGELAAAAPTGTCFNCTMANWFPPLGQRLLLLLLRVVKGGDSGAKIKEEQCTNWALLPCYELRSFVYSPALMSNICYIGEKTLEQGEKTLSLTLESWITSTWMGHMVQESYISKQIPHL
jgi:hypothetical protein